MTFSQDKIALVHVSYRAIERDARDYSDLFYHRLLQLHPFTRILFPDDMNRQVETFRRTIHRLVEGMDALDALKPTLAELGRRHVEYGVQAHHYAIVGEVLIDTLAEILGARFCTETRNAWTALYAAVAQIMIAAVDCVNRSEPT